MGATVVIITKGPYQDLKGKIIRYTDSRTDNPRFKIRFDIAHNAGSKSVIYRWMSLDEFILENDEGYKLIFCN